MTAVATTEFISFDRIKEQYPAQWILVGNPVLKDENLQTALVKNLLGGIVLDHDADRHLLATRAQKMRSRYRSVALVYTGKIPKNRRFLL